MFTQNSYETVTLVSGTSMSSDIRIHGAEKVAIELPAFGTKFADATTSVYVYGADAPTSTYRRIQVQGIYSAASGIYDWEVPNNAGNSIVICPPAIGFNYIKVEFYTAATDGYTFAVWTFKN